MEDNLDCDFERHLKMLIEVTEKSGKLRKDLKDNIMQSVSGLRLVFNNLLNNMEEKDNKIQELEKQPAYPSISQNNILDGGKKYSDIVQNKVGNDESKFFKLIVKSKNNQSTDYMKTVIKSKINPTEMKIGIRSFKSLRNGLLLIEAQKKEEIELVCKNINHKCGDELEANAPRLRKPQLIVYSVPDDLTLDSAKEAILEQNSELNLKEEDVTPKFTFKDRRNNNNLIVEVNPEARKKLIVNKVKIGWNMCNTGDYLRLNRCFKCSKFNHKAKDCKGDLTCPHCAGEHSGRDCNSNKDVYQCINCINYNKYNKTHPINIHHSSMDKSCRCYQTALKKYMQNIDY